MSFWGKLFNKKRWVLIGSNDFITDYYDSTLVKVYKDNPPCITVMVKRIHTNNGKEILFANLNTHNINTDELIDIHHSISGYNIYLRQMKKEWLATTYVSKSGKILKGGSSIMDNYLPFGLVDIKAGTVDELKLNKILHDNNS